MTAGRGTIAEQRLLTPQISNITSTPKLCTYKVIYWFPWELSLTTVSTDLNTVAEGHGTIAAQRLLTPHTTNHSYLTHSPPSISSPAGYSGYKTHSPYPAAPLSGLKLSGPVLLPKSIGHSEFKPGYLTWLPHGYTNTACESFTSLRL